MSTYSVGTISDINIQKSIQNLGNVSGSVINPNYSQWGSQWGEPIDWSKLNYTESYRRKFIRHPSGMGTVMSMNDGIDRNILVLDAQYRQLNGYAYYNSDIDLGLTQCRNCGYFTGNSQSSLPYASISDVTIASFSTYYYYANQDPNTSKYNTDNLVGDVVAVTPVPDPAQSQAANYCRSITITHNEITVGCDLPNINVLCRLYAAMIKLDSMDESPSGYDNLKLSKWWNSNDYCCWSSTWYGNYDNNYYALNLADNSDVYYYNIHSHPGLAVVLEI